MDHSGKFSLLSDILWSDPCENDDDALNVNWCENENRGCSFVFGSRAATSFLNENDLLSINNTCTRG